MFTRPNEVVVTPKTLEFNGAELVNPAGAVAPKQLQRFATGNIPLYVPRQAISLFPTSRGEDKGPPLGRRG